MRDLFPTDEDEYRKLLTWCTDAFLAATSAREPHEERWDRYDKHYEAFIRRDEKDWRSRVFMPEVFQQIETIKPRLIQNLPKFLAAPVGPEDVESARVMEFLLQWSAHSSDLHLELVKLFHPVLLYGTGILKTFPDTRYAWGSEMVPIFERETQLIENPLIDPDTQRPMLDPDGNQVIDRQEIPIEVPVGVRPERKRYVAYDGPAGRAVDVKNFWPAPEAEDVQSARYCIHRVFKNVREVRSLVAQGVYQWPDFVEENALTADHDDPRLQRLDAVDKGPGTDPTRKQIELLEYWTNDGHGTPGRVITVANRRVILRVAENPFWHGRKPFIRFVDCMLPHRFWGIGEVQAMEGIQDAINAIVNQRIDNGRLTMDQMYAVNESQIVDRSDLKTRPGGVIRVKGDFNPQEAIFPLNRGGVPGSAFTEVAELQAMGERVTGVSSYQQGVDSPSQHETATGAAIMQEAGASRFHLKVKLMEIDPLRELTLHFGSLLQQFTTQERVIRILGPDGAAQWEQIDPAALQGAFDYMVETSTSQQSETMRKQQALDTFGQVAQAVQMGVLPPQVALPAFREVLEAMEAKTVLKTLDDLQQMQEQQQQLGQGQPLPSEPPPGEPSPEELPPEVAAQLAAEMQGQAPAQ